MSDKTGSNGNKSPMSHGDYVFRGAAIGAGAAGFVSLLRQALEAKRQSEKKKARESGGVGQDTIVLRVRKRKNGEEKTAESAACTKLEKDHAPKVTVRPCVESGETRPTGAGQPREVNGRFTNLPVREKRAGLVRDMFREGSGLYLGTGAAIGSFVLARRLFERLEQNRLKDQIAAAQTEYLDLLDGKQVKGAEAFAKMFMIGDDSVAKIEKAAAEAAGIEPERLEKSAQVFSDIKYFVDNLRPAARHIGAGGVLMYLLGVTGSAYVAKKLMDQRFAETGEEPPHKVPKIVMKAAEAEFEVQPEQVLATIGIMRDCIANSTPAKVFEKMAQSDPTALDPFVDLVRNESGGIQKVLDVYSTLRGVGPSDGSIDYKDLNTIMGGALSDQDRMAMINGYVFDEMRRDPRRWFHVLGDKRNANLLNYEAQQYLANGSFPWARVPLGMWWVTNNKNGRAYMGKLLLNKYMGVSDDNKVDDILSHYDFGHDNWTAKDGYSAIPGNYDTVPVVTPGPVDTPAPQAPSTPAGTSSPVPNDNPATKAAESAGVKSAGVMDLSGLMGVLSRSKTLSDSTNKEILARLDKLQDGGRRRAKDEGVEVEFDDDLASILSPEDREKILRALGGRA